MVSANQLAMITTQEALFLDEADQEMWRKGFTEMHCPRCGSDIIREDCGSAYIVRCETDGCIGTTYRGI